MNRTLQHTIRLALKIGAQLDTDAGRPLIGLAYDAGAVFTIDPAGIAAAAAGLVRRGWHRLAARVRAEVDDWRATFQLIGQALTPAPEVICYG